MKKSITIFAFIFVVATLFTACNWAPEGNSWDYKNVKDLSYGDKSYKISSGSKYRGIAYITTHGGSGEWRFKNDSDKTIKCKYAEKFSLKGESSLSYFYEKDDGTITYGETIKGKEFEVPAGASIKIYASTSYRIKSGGSKEDFFKFYLACD